MRRKLIMIFIASAILCGACGVKLDEGKSSSISLNKEKQESDAHSIWIDGFEIKIMEYLDEDSMSVQFVVGDALIQAVLPRELETEAYVVKKELNEYDKMKEEVIAFHHAEGKNFFAFNCTSSISEEMYQEHYEFYENYHGQSGTREILDSETGVSVYWYNGSFEHEGESFDFIGCMREDYNSKLQTVLTMYIGAIDASELEIRKEYLKMVSISEKNPAMEQETEEDVKVSHIFSYPTEEMVAKDLKENINWDILNWVPMKYEKYSFSPVTFERSEGDKAYYSQILLIEYPLFTREFKYMVEYTYQDSKWQMGNTSCCYENYVLKDEIIGTWQTCIEASHPMHVDSYMTLHLSKIDDSNCEYDFYWTSRIPGGRDQSFRGTYTIKPVMDENIFLDHLVIGYDNANGYIIINNEGIVFKPVASTNEYILYKN